MTVTPRRLALIVLVIATVSAAALAAEGGSTPSFGLGLGIGVQTFTDTVPPTTYQSLSLSPDLAFGKFGIGLAVTLNYRFTGSGIEVRLKDWWPQSPDPVTLQSVAAIYLPKIKYVRWGEKGDPLFIKLGSIDDATLGNGFIVSNYANTLFLPEQRHFGLNLDVDGSLFSFPYVGLETMVGNLAEFDVIGGRLYVRPLVGTSIPILKNLEFGGTVAADTKPYLYRVPAGTAPAVVVFGGDVRLPIVYLEKVFSLVTFADVASTPSGASDRAWGGAVGLGGKIFSFLTYGAQVRVLGADFIPTYFDATYDILRDAKYDLTQAGGFADPTMGWLATLGTTFFDEKIIFRVTLDAPFTGWTTDPMDLVKNPHLRGVFTIADGIIPGISLDTSYDKSGITKWADLVSPLNAAIQAKLNYKSGPAIISFVYKVRYDPSVPSQWVVTSGLESSIQLF